METVDWTSAVMELKSDLLERGILSYEPISSGMVLNPSYYFSKFYFVNEEEYARVNYSNALYDVMIMKIEKTIKWRDITDAQMSEMR